MTSCVSQNIVSCQPLPLTQQVTVLAGLILSSNDQIKVFPIDLLQGALYGPPLFCAESMRNLCGMNVVFCSLFVIIAKLIPLGIFHADSA